VSSVTSLLTMIDGHGFEDIDTTSKVAFINDIYWDICGRETWPFLEKDLTLTFDGSSAIPTNWPTDFSAVVVAVDTVTGRRLYPMRIDTVRDTFAKSLTQAGNPRYYYFLASQFYAWPVPPASATESSVKMTYIHTPAALTAGSSEAAIIIPPRYHTAILYGTLSQLYDMEDETVAAQRFEAKYEKKLSTMRDNLWNRQVDRPDTIEIVDAEDYYN